MRAKLVKEGIESLWDEGNQKALRSLVDRNKPKVEYTVTTEHPVVIKSTDDVEIARVKMIFNKNRIKFTETEKKL